MVPGGDLRLRSQGVIWGEAMSSRIRFRRAARLARRAGLGRQLNPEGTCRRAGVPARQEMDTDVRDEVAREPVVALQPAANGVTKFFARREKKALCPD